MLERCTISNSIMKNVWFFFYWIDLKPAFSPFQQAKEHLKEPISSRSFCDDFFVGKTTKKGGEYNFQVAIISSSAYKDLTKKYAAIK